MLTGISNEKLWKGQKKECEALYFHFCYKIKVIVVAYSVVVCQLLVTSPVHTYTMPNTFHFLEEPQTSQPQKHAVSQCYYSAGQRGNHNLQFAPPSDRHQYRRAGRFPIYKSRTNTACPLWFPTATKSQSRSRRLSAQVHLEE